MCMHDVLTSCPEGKNQVLSSLICLRKEFLLHCEPVVGYDMYCALCNQHWV